MDLSIARDKHLELKKHINAIHCTNNLTLVQRKLFNALLFRAYPELPHKTKFQIQARQLCELIGYNSNDYGKLKRALLGLITIAIEWNVIDALTGKEKKWKASAILASAELEGGYCSYEYSQVMRDFLYQPEIYGRINIALVAKFKSSYGLALYENCIRYQGLSQTPWFSLEVFRKLMGVFGEKYSVFKDFKKRVLNIAIEEVNAISPVHVYAEIERKNQKATRIRLKISKKTHPDAEKIKRDLVDDELLATLSTIFGLSEQLISQSLEKYGYQYIKEKVEMILQSENFLSGNIRGLAGYLLEALKKDYKASKSSKKVVDAHRQKRRAGEKASKDSEENRKNNYDNYVNKKIADYLSHLSKTEYKELEGDFDVQMKEKGGFLLDWYKKHGVAHPAVKACFNDFIKKHKSRKLGQILSFKDFITVLGEYN